MASPRYSNEMNDVCRLYLTGASCSGVTTLGRELALLLAVQHLDVDDFYWLPTDPPFTMKRAPEDRVRQIRERQGNSGWVLTGSFDGWGDTLIGNVDLIVFLDTPHINTYGTSGGPREGPFRRAYFARW